MRRFTLIGEGTMDFVEIYTEDEAKLFEEFFRAAYPASGMASYLIETKKAPMPLRRTDAEEERVRELMMEFGIWKVNK